MAVSGEGYRVVLGSIALAWTIISVTGSLACLYQTHGSAHSPFRDRSLAMLVVGTSSCFIGTIWCCVVEIWGLAEMPCWLYFWGAALISPLVAGATVVNGFRLVLMWRYERMKEGAKYGKMQLSAEQVHELQRAKHAFSEQYILSGWLVHMLLLLAAALPLFFTDQYWSSGDSGCRVRNADTIPAVGIDHLDAFWFLTSCIYIPSAMWLIYTLWFSGKRDGLGLFRDLILQLITNAGGFVCFEIARYIWPSEWMHDEAPFMYLHALQPPLYCCMFVLYPTLAPHVIDAWRLRRTKSTNQVAARPSGDSSEEIEDVLSNQTGIAWLMIQCQTEFCPETLQCVLAIRRLRREWNKQSYDGLLALYGTFIEANSPFEVNISAALRQKVTTNILALQKETLTRDQFATFFTAVESELVLLLTSNSYARFKKSQSFVDYAAGRTPTTDKTRVSYTSATYTNNFTAPVDDEGKIIIVTTPRVTVSPRMSGASPRGSGDKSINDKRLSRQTLGFT